MAQRGQMAGAKESASTAKRVDKEAKTGSAVTRLARFKTSRKESHPSVTAASHHQSQASAGAFSTDAAKASRAEARSPARAADMPFLMR